MKELVKGFIEGPRYIGNRVLKGIRYFLIGCYTILTSRVSVMVLVISLALAMVQVSSGYREEILLKEQEMMYENDSLSVDYYYDDTELTDYNDNMAITDLFDCYQKDTNLDEVPVNIVESIKGLEELYGSNSKYFSFLYQDLFSGFTVSYNADGAIFTASAIKAPAMIYIYEMASLGNIDLNERLVYTSNYYQGGRVY